MRLQAILHGGPFDGVFMSLSKVNGDWPMDLRTAAGLESAAKEMVEAHYYRRHDVDERGLIFMGSYKFTHTALSKSTLIEHWLAL